ncbi:copper homeostasis protein CutC [Vibrio azureus]|uniref:PF03932 family protein CutC n=1 Tax=Vibrio azureus NBRC 104587 TaxID=1219077 RepID=U3ART5_9VIBR|nr:copper homeostasis protein CutC [Vibrio azureus]AUI85378.1 copper homeostasis protein CutC [Vibrio azureus]GAD76465.1 copper homeostasis protein CutC [Vibrio azureus NBRC 104587]
MQLEVCIDNIESLHNAIEGGATRIELCSSLALGGLTPSYGFMQQAGKLSTVPIYAMIRPRQGDFFYSEQEIETMLIDIKAAKQAGLNGVVFGVLTQDGHVHTPFTRTLCKLAQQLGLGVTFHRAFDQCCNAQTALEEIIQLGCERVLTSGLAPSAYQGVAQIKALVKQANSRISVMAGAGINAENVGPLIRSSQVKEIHLSGKIERPSKMTFIAEQSKMGADDVDDFSIPVTSRDRIAQVSSAITRNDDS